MIEPNKQTAELERSKYPMTLQQQILDEMKRRKVTAQAPMPVCDILVNSDYDVLFLAEIELELEKMVTCRPPLLSRMQHTKNGITQMVYWPTGMHQIISYSDPAKKVAATPVRREITPQKQESPTIMNNIDSQPSAEFDLLSYIWLNPNCSLSQAERGCGINVNCAKGYLSWYFTQGYLLKTPYKNTNQISYSIKAAGMTAAQLFELRQNQKSLNDMASKNSTPINALPQNELDIFNFLISSNKDVINNAKLLPKEAETIKKPDYGDFKVAYTSNGTLMLIGLQYAAIELNHEQVETLYDFMNTSVNIQ